MKKLLGIVVLGLLISGNAYSKDIKLICKDVKDEAISHILIFNDTEKSLKVERDTGFFELADVGVYNSDEIDANVMIKIDGKIVQQMNYQIDRRTGVLFLVSYFFDNGSMYSNTSNCELFKKNKF